jgi:hypothetical protein
VQKADFAQIAGKKTCLFLSHLRAIFRQKPLSANILANRPAIGPLLDTSLKPGARPALAITRRKDGR